jgi:hypothetical protein
VRGFTGRALRAFRRQGNERAELDVARGSHPPPRHTGSRSGNAAARASRPARAGAVMERAGLSSMAPDPRLQRQAEWCVAALLVVAFYTSYRYPLQINSSTTSPTYSDTPLWLSSGKYLIVGGIFLWTVLRRALLRIPVRVPQPLAVLAFAYLAVVPVAAMVFTRNLTLIEIGFFFLVPIVLLLFAGVRIPVRVVNRCVLVYLYFALVVEAIQVLLLLTIGRLPALAYAGSLSIRFGSNLDDPNGFGLLLAMLMPFAGAYYTGVRRAVLLFLLGVCALLTQSLTALAVLSVVLVVFTTVSASRHIRSAFAVLVSTAAVIAAGAAVWVAYGHEIQNTYRLYMLTKSGSISEHGYALELLRHLRLLNWLGLEPTHRDLSETAYVNILAVLGLPYLLVFLALGVRAAWRVVALLRLPGAGRDVRAFACASAGLLISMYVGCLALPVPAIFPNNLIFITFLTMLVTFDDPAPAAEVPEAQKPIRRLARV